jgi:hypothetical protein
MTKNIIKYIKTRIKLFKTFDWILIGCGLIAVILFAVLFFRKSTFITVTVSVGEDSAVYGSFWGNIGPKYWFANAFRKGQKEKSGLGKVQAEILNVYSYDKVPGHKTVYLDVKINTVYNRATNTYTYKGTAVLVGSTIKLNLDSVFAQGLVTEVQGFPARTERKTIQIETQMDDQETTFLGTAATKGYLADSIQVGDIVKDNKGIALIKVLDKKVQPAEVTVATSDGRIIKASDPVRKDVFLTLEIAVEKIDGKYYFLNDIPILVNQPIPINTSITSIFPVVTKFLTY